MVTYLSAAKGIGAAALVAILYVTSCGDQALPTRPLDWELPTGTSPAQPYPGAVARPRPLVAVVGLSRTGTSSLCAALEMLNYTVFHTQQTVEHHLDFWHYYLSGRIARPYVRKLLDPLAVSAVADCWYALLAPEIIRAYPDAKFILSTRDVDKWHKSYISYISGSHLYHFWRQLPRLVASVASRTFRIGRVARAVGLIEDTQGFELEKLPQLRHIWRRSDEVFYSNADPGASPQHWKDTYQRHTAYIRSIIPKDQLLEFDPSKGQGWKELVDFLRVPREAARVTSQPFPHKFAAGQVAAGGVSSDVGDATRGHVALVFALLVAAAGAIAAPRIRDARAAIRHMPGGSDKGRDADGHEFAMVRPRHERPPPSFAARAREAWQDLSLRIDVWWRLFNEHGAMVEVYEKHRKDGYFQYGEPGDFAKLHDHKATRELLAFRCGRPPIAAGGAAGATAAADNGDGGVGNNNNGSAAEAEDARPGQGLHSELRFEDDGSLLPTYLSVEHGAGAALGALALAAADLFELRTGESQEVLVRRTDAGLATGGYLFLKVDAQGAYDGCDGFAATIEQEGKVNPVRKAYTCADGRSVFLHGGFPKLKQGILDFFGGVPPKVEAIAEQAAKWSDAAELEKAMQARGLAATLCRTPVEWRASEQGKAVLASPLIDIDVRRNAPPGAPPARLLPSGLSVTRPLSDVIVLDFSHVIASPVVGRSLLDHGATVIKLVTHARPRRHLFDEEANAGKLTYELNLETEAGRARLWAMLRAADVLIDGYTDGVLARHGFPIDDVLGVCPHLVYCQVACYGFTGPFEGRKGFQQNANFCAGVAGLEDEELLGYQLVSQIDYATGFLGAYAVVLGLTHRQLTAAAGQPLRGVRVRVSLCGTATWMAQFGAHCPAWGEYVGRITRLLFGCGDRPVKAGNLTHLPSAVHMTATPPTRVPGFHRWWREAKKYKL